MAARAARPDAARFSARLTIHQATPRLVALLFLPVMLLASVAIARAGLAPNAIERVGGAENATTEELTTNAAEVLTDALTRGAGITFEIVQTSTITAREGGPLVEVPDPADRTKSLGEADRYVIGTLIERGWATPDGYWMEILYGPEPGKDAEYDLTKAQVSREALVRDGKQYRNDGPGWHETDQLPGIGLDPATLAKLTGLLPQAKDATDVPLEAPRAIDPEAVKDAPLGPRTVAVDPDALAASIEGLEGPAAEPVRALAKEASPADLPGIVAIDLETATELLAPVELRFDDAGRLVTLVVLARNTNQQTHDLIVETVINLRYPDDARDLPKPEPVYVEPAPDPDGETEG